MTVTYTQEALPYILDCLGLSVTTKDYVVDKEGKPVVDVDGNNFKASALIGIYKDKFITKPSQLLNLPALADSSK